MREDEPIRPLLKEWVAPEPDAAMDARIRAAWREALPQTGWPRWWTARVSVPVPLLTALVLALVALLLELRPAPRAVQREPGYVTRLGAAGFQPLPDGAARVVPMEEVRQ